MASPKKLTKEVVESIIARQYEGEKLADIANDIGASCKGIHLAAKREGLEIKSIRRDKTIVMQKILDRKSDIESGKVSMHKLAKELGMSQPYISLRCKELGIKSPWRCGYSEAQIEEFEKVLNHLKEYGGYIPQAIKRLNVSCDRQSVHQYAKSIGFDPKVYRYSNHVFGCWKILPGIPEPCYTADYKVTALCMLCDTTHQVLMTNLRGGTSTCCFACSCQNRVNAMVKCEQTGQMYRSIRAFALELGIFNKYQTIKRRIRIDGYYEHEDLTYRLDI